MSGKAKMRAKNTKRKRKIKKKNLNKQINI